MRIFIIPTSNLWSQKFRNECGREQKKPNHCRFSMRRIIASLKQSIWCGDWAYSTRVESPHINGVEALAHWFRLLIAQSLSLHHDGSFLKRSHNLIASTPTPGEIKPDSRIKNCYFAIMIDSAAQLHISACNLLTNAAAAIYDLHFHFEIEKKVANADGVERRPEHCSNY